MKEYKCKFCQKETKPLGLFLHQKLCPKNPEAKKENHPSYGRKGKNQYSNGLRMSEETRENISKKISGRKLSDNHKLNLSKAMKIAVKQYPESYSLSNISGRTKVYDYNGFKLKGGWELSFAKFLDSLSIKWTNRIKPFEYFWNNSFHLYFPDFYLIDLDLYVEVKGYEIDRDLSKWSVVDNLIIIKKTEINLIKNGLFSIFDLILKWYI